MNGWCSVNVLCKEAGLCVCLVCLVSRIQYNCPRKERERGTSTKSGAQREKHSVLFLSSSGPLPVLILSSSCPHPFLFLFSPCSLPVLILYSSIPYHVLISHSSRLHVILIPSLIRPICPRSYLFLILSLSHINPVLMLSSSYPCNVLIQSLNLHSIPLLFFFCLYPIFILSLSYLILSLSLIIFVLTRSSSFSYSNSLSFVPSSCTYTSFPPYFSLPVLVLSYHPVTVDPYSVLPCPYYCPA